MRIVLQNRGSKLYLKTRSSWTPVERAARRFRSSLEASEFCSANKLKGVQVVLKFSDPRYEFRLDV